jgi:microcystin degradation protein MlrC
VLLDMGDNVGGGAMGDGTALLHECRLANAGPVFACIHDPEAVLRAVAAGEGGTLDNLAVGDPMNPFSADFRVAGIYDGKFSEGEVRHGGFQDFDQGRTAVIEASGGSPTLMLTSRRVPPFSLRQMTAFGVDPSRFRIIIAKGVIAPVAAYESIATGGFVHVDTPGPTRADMTKLVYRNRRRPMFPFEKRR